MMLEEDEALPGGTSDDPDYRTLVREKVKMALIDNKLLPLSEETLEKRGQKSSGSESLTAAEYRDRLEDLTDRFAVLGIPLLFDRSADEPTQKGQAAWIKLYGILYGKESKANSLYDAAIA